MNNFNDPVSDITFGQGMQISLNNYYDILKAQAGGLGVGEFLQLKLVADSVDISKPLNEGGIYEWFSYYNLLNRSDLQIVPQPLSGSVLTGVAHVSDIYGKFLNKLSSLVTTKTLSPVDQAKVDQLTGDIGDLQVEIIKFVTDDYTNWMAYCKLRGISPGDNIAFSQWSAAYGNSDRIQSLMDTKVIKIYQKTQLINTTYANPDDQEIIDALVGYTNAAMQLCYPTFPDNDYLPTVISLNYLSGLPHMSTALYDNRYVVTFDKTLDFIKTAAVGTLNAEFSKTTDDSSSITTDWSYSGSIGYAFIHVSVSESDHTTISQDFQKAISLDLSAKASLRVNINYGSWFKPNLFESQYITDNPDMFQEFFGNTGTLLYYPTALVLIRGFEIDFKSSQNWVYDYENKFSASAGGGFNVFGINFGASGSYTQDTKEHHVDQSDTTLTIGDDENTLRFVGYVVKKNESIIASRHANYKSMGLL